MASTACIVSRAGLPARNSDETRVNAARRSEKGRGSGAIDTEADSGATHAGTVPCVVRRVLLVTVAVLLAANADTAERRGAIAFHYATPLTPAELAWYGRFDLLVTHDPLPREQVDALHRRGTKLVIYEWAVAFYASRAGPWNRKAPVLNRAPLRGHLGARDADAFYYDPATREHQQGRAAMLARRVKALGYDGVFLDTTTKESVHPAALAEYAHRHPEVDYDEAFAGFLRNLRRSVRVIVTNQGYRAAKLVLPYVDWDVTESLITWPRNGHFVLRPWNDPKDAWNSTAFLMKNLIAPVRKQFPRVRFAHINYLDTIDATRVAELIAITRLFDAEPVIAHPQLSTMVPSELLFVELGAPSARVDRTDGAYRLYEHGVVAYNAGARPMRIKGRGRTFVVPPRSALIERFDR